MAEYIEREKTVKLLRSIGSRDYRREKGTIQDAIKMVSSPEYTPTADVVQVRHGEWIEKDDGWGGTYYDCSACGVSWTTIDGTPMENGMNFCPNCGAKMDGADNA